MASGYQPSIPLKTDQIDGPFVLTKSYNENARQNVRMIVLTEKGEKLTDINFGCGLKRFLFEAQVSEAEVTSLIREQIRSYAPYINITNIQVSSKEQVLQILVSYVIVPTNTTQTDLLEVTA